MTDKIGCCANIWWYGLPCNCTPEEKAKREPQPPIPSALISLLCCHFCGKDKGDVEYLITEANKAAICDECIDIVSGILQDERATAAVK